MIDVTTLPPEQVKALQQPHATATPCGCNECRRERSLARVKADLDAGYYDQDHVIAAAAHDLAKSGDVSAVLGDARPAPSGERRDLAEADGDTLTQRIAKGMSEDAERIEWDKNHDGDRFE
jgi:hypothetical protein